jgi:hypothetical protein
VPMVHRCTWPDCTTLTMGEFCLDHERQGEAGRLARVRVHLPRLATAAALTVAAAAGALIATRLPR